MRWLEVSATRKAGLRMVQTLSGALTGRRCLAVLAEDVLLGAALQKGGGQWSTVSILEEPGLVAASLFGSALATMHEGRIPQPDHSFDLVVLDQVLEHFEDDGGVISECHRVLNESGILVVRTVRQRRFSLTGVIRRLLGMANYGRGRARPGYTESLLFDILKDGFDTEDVRTGSRFFAELAETMIQVAVVLSGAARPGATGQVGDRERTLHTYRKIARMHAVFYPVALLGQLLDGLLFLSRGHRLAIRARRRDWKPRRTPSLKDGRSIAEATINTKIGTAGPF